jgi:hypothetical protein
MHAMTTRQILAAAALVAGCLVHTAGSLVAQTPVPDADPAIEKLVASVSEERLQQLLEKLVSFGTRNTLSDQSSPSRGIGAARQWIFDELKRSSARLQVAFDTYMIAQQGRITRDVELRNVVAVLPGKSDRRIYVSGHYDSLNLGPRGQLAGNTRGAGQSGAPGSQQPAGQAPATTGPPAQAGQQAGGQGARRPPADPNLDAPGANDDGSGTVLTMELARVFAESGIEFDATLVFICWAGEEQGLIGSKAHAQKISAEKVVVEALFNNDIVGNVTGGNGVVDAESVRVYSEGPEDSMSRSLARFIQGIAAKYVPAHRVRLMIRHDRFGRGSDHTSFNQHGYPAIVFRESNENYDKQHSARDTIDGVSFPYLAKNARINAAGVATLALAPPAPELGRLGRGTTGYDADLRWTASPGAVAYRIYWREAWTPDWQHALTVGNGTQHVFPNVSIDDFVFGVAAIGPKGHESLARAYVNPPRADVEVKVIR